MSKKENKRMYHKGMIITKDGNYFDCIVADDEYAVFVHRVKHTLEETRLDYENIFVMSQFESSSDFEIYKMDNMEVFDLTNKTKEQKWN